MNELNIFIEKEYHEIQYFIEIYSKDQILFLNIIEKENGNIWNNEFAFPYLESLTMKAGNYKEIKTFLKILEYGILEKCDKIIIDIASNYDLNMTQKNKRKYFIITYIDNLEKFYFPLPLIYQEISENKLLYSKIISRVKNEIINRKNLPFKSCDLILENSQLLQKIQKLQNYEASEIQISQLKLELEKSQQNLAKLRSEFDFPKENSSDIGFCIMQKRRELDEIKIESKEIIKKQEIYFFKNMKWVLF